MAGAKILFVVEAMGGGVFTYIVDLANELVSIYDVYIAYAVRNQTPYDYKTYFDKRIHLIEVKNFMRSVNPMKDTMAFFEIRRIADKIQPDIIHLHSSKAGAIGRWALDTRNTTIFYTPHGYSFLMANQSNVKRIIYRLVETISARRNCMTISCSGGEHQETLKLTNCATFVDNGINIKQLQAMINDAGEIEEHPFTVFTLGRICYQKNPELFNKVAEALPNVKFIWIGDGELREKLTAPNIEVTGWLDRKNALWTSLNTDVFVLTSLWEGLPMSLLEAMYLKKLCIVNNVIGNRDVIHSGENGFVCETVDEFVSAIRKSMEEKMNSKVNNGKTVPNYKISSLIEHAYNEITEKYNITVMARKYSDIYQRELNNRDGR